ncbi:MAG TPA: LysM peptidoglycan-binding domain-containing protein [Thermoanaerobaculia bacterium]
MRVRLSRFVLATLLAGSSSALAADRPPQDLHLVDGHWTAWNPPVPPPGEQVHIIAKGDTLWDLAAKYYGDPYLWPQIWERNQYVLDAHWIYPGDPLVLGPQVAPVDNLSQVPGSTGGPGTGEPGADPNAPPPDGAISAAEAAGSPIPLGAETDIYCQGYIGDLEEPFPFIINGSEAEAQALIPQAQIPGSTDKVRGGWKLVGYGPPGTVKFSLSTGDIVYVDGGRARGLSAGTQFTVVAPNEPVFHPIRHQVVGRYYRYLGRVRILSVQENTGIAEIIHSCDPITVGSFLTPFEPEPVPLGRPTAMRPVNFPAAAEKIQTAPAIVYVRDNILALGEDHVVHIDLGEDAATPGDVFTIYRENRPGLPPVVLGELAVLSVHKHFAVAKILESRYPIYVGDRLDPK